jgi:hypothetical protein
MQHNPSSPNPHHHQNASNPEEKKKHGHENTIPSMLQKGKK